MEQQLTDDAHGMATTNTIADIERSRERPLPFTNQASTTPIISNRQPVREYNIPLALLITKQVK